MLPLELRDVSFAINGRTLIDHVSVEIGAGPRTVILGPNGAGKSVLMRLCHGLLPASAGRIIWRGAGSADGSRQAMVFQRPVMLRRSALANVVYGLKLAGVSRAERELRAADVLDAVDLSAVSGRPARVLSGGEQQRLALARAWALNPEVLFLDEPTANLDPNATRDVESIINQICAGGTKIIMSTHNLGQARRLGDEILFLSHGRLVERSPVEQFFKQPASAEAAAFIRAELPWN
ncbi:MAG: phosphate ABC transporter ATP-binding protein [Betaproteobacteria bacterium]|jgi:tungstate transport system ATP-binding protein|nr:MAG: ABC transporter ATP-binding protein [Betaproteobacteria bacterium SG8_41]UCF74470.1 MAG: phosphate ABC transporter ATP-binding protein [Betaproteobacteria bacterium]